MKRLLTVILSLSLLLLGGNPVKSQEAELSINLKVRPIVIGPVIKLHEICNIVPENQQIKISLENITLGKAAPPGETRELSLSFIKQRLRQAGLKDLVARLKGPLIIRITTAPQEIHKTLPEEPVTEVLATSSQV